MQLEGFVGNDGFLSFCIEKHARYFFVQNLSLQILNVSEDLVQVVRMKCGFLVMRLKRLAVELGINDKHASNACQDDVGDHYGQKGS